MGLQLEHATPTTAGGDVRTDSVLDMLRAGFDDTETKGPKHLDLPVPLRKVGMRFAAIDRDLFDEMQRSEDRDTNLDFLAAACESILVRDENGRWRPAVHDGIPVKFDGSLSEVMGWHTESPREEVLRAFAEVPQPYLAIAEHVALVQAWMAGRAEQREEDLLGES